MKNRTLFALLASVGCLAACATPDTTLIDPGMSKAQVSEVFGAPVTRSFRGSREAWQYQNIVGFGQCKYSTVWFDKGLVVALTSRSGPSIAGCGLGSQEVNWGQAPQDGQGLVNINIKNEIKNEKSEKQ